MKGSPLKKKNQDYVGLPFFKLICCLERILNGIGHNYVLQKNKSYVKIRKIINIK